MGALFAIERTISGQPPEERRRVRRLRARPMLDELKTFLDTASPLSGKSVLAGDPLCPRLLAGAGALSPATAGWR